MKKNYLFVVAFVLLLAVLFSVNAQHRDRTVSQPTKLTTSKPKSLSVKLDARQKLTAEQMTSFFENLTIEFQYGYVENLDDGRGFTAGRIGFTTGTSDALIVINKYTEIVPQNPLAKYIPELERLEEAEDRGDTENLEGFETAWQLAARDEKFRKIQDNLNEEIYFDPSQKMADDLGLKFALSRAALYDANVQHGGGNSADSLEAMISKTNSAMKGSPKEGIDEALWLTKFLDVRESVLLNPENEETQEEWAGSVERVKVFKTLLEKKNFVLKLPIQINCFNESVKIS
jgi:chitosanase